MFKSLNYFPLLFMIVLSYTKSKSVDTNLSRSLRTSHIVISLVLSSRKTSAVAAYKWHTNMGQLHPHKT